MEYSTARISIRKLSPTPASRISIAQQYKNNQPIVTPLRKPQKASNKVANSLPSGHACTASNSIPRLRLLSWGTATQQDDLGGTMDMAVDALADNYIEPTDGYLTHSLDLPTEESTAPQAPDGYEVFFDAVISGGLPFYQLSHKTFVANGWILQKSEASVRLLHQPCIYELTIKRHTGIIYTPH